MKAIILVASGLRPDFIGCYGNEWVDTPNLDQLAAAGVVFDRHFADVPDAAGTRRGWRTGLYHLPRPETAAGPPLEPADLVRLLRDRGVATALVVDGSRPTPAEFQAGWDTVEVVAAKKKASPLEKTLETATDALDRLAARDNWLLWVDLQTLVPPWDVPEDFLAPFFEEDEDEGEDDEAEEPALALEPLLSPPGGPVAAGDDETFLRLQRTYGAAVSYFDAGVNRLLDALVERGLGEQVLLVITSDRGQALAERGVVGECRPCLHEEMTHQPLIVRLPSGAEAGRRVPALTQSVDLFPTLLEAFAVAVPPVHGHSLFALMRGRAKSVRPYAVSGLQVGDAIEWSLRTPEWGFLLPVRPGEDDSRGQQLYVKPDDAWEVNNVVNHHLDLAEKLEKVLRDFVDATARPGPLQPPEV